MGKNEYSQTKISLCKVLAAGKLLSYFIIPRRNAKVTKTTIKLDECDNVYTEV